MAISQNYGTGRRKSAAARAFLRPGTGKITVNGRTLENYFPNAVLRMMVHQPLVLADLDGKFDMIISVCGGGPAGQASAIRLGISRSCWVSNNWCRRMRHDVPSRSSTNRRGRNGSITT